MHKVSWLTFVKQEPGVVGQPPGWRKCPRFLLGHSAGGASWSSCGEGEDTLKTGNILKCALDNCC